MSSSASPKQRKHLENKRERRPPHPAKLQLEDGDESPADLMPASDPGSFIEPVTKDDPGATRMPSAQKEPPRLKGP
jgi:hypothetical protein